MWVETVTEGGRRFMTAWTKEVDVTRHRPEKRDANETRKVIICSRKHRTCQATAIGLVDEPKKLCTGTRRTETCVGPRHVDTSRGAQPTGWMYAVAESGRTRE